MLDIDAIVTRVKTAKGFHSDKDLAAFLGLSSADFSNRKKRDTLLPLLVNLAINDDIDIDLLIRGRNREFSDQADNDLMKGIVCDIYSLQNSSEPFDWQKHGPISKITLSEEYCEEMTLLKMFGTSMEPTILNDSVIAVDCGIVRLSSGKIHVLWIPGEGPIVRRVFVDFGKVILRADNPQYPDITITAGSVPNEHFVLGCVKWVLQDL